MAHARRDRGYARSSLTPGFAVTPFQRWRLPGFASVIAPKYCCGQLFLLVLVLETRQSKPQRPRPRTRTRNGSLGSIPKFSDFSAVSVTDFKKIGLIQKKRSAGSNAGQRIAYEEADILFFHDPVRPLFTRFPLCPMAVPPPVSSEAACHTRYAAAGAGDGRSHFP